MQEILYTSSRIKCDGLLLRRMFSYKRKICLTCEASNILRKWGLFHFESSYVWSVPTLDFINIYNKCFNFPLSLLTDSFHLCHFFGTASSTWLWITALTKNYDIIILLILLQLNSILITRNKSIEMWTFIGMKLKCGILIGSEEDLADWTKWMNSRSMVYDKDYSLLQLQ